MQYGETCGLLLDASSGKPLPGFDRLEGGELAPVGDHLLLQHGRVLDSRTAKTVWTIPADLVGGGDGIVAAVTYLDRRHITAYRASASEGSGCGSTTRLWQYEFPDNDKSLHAMGSSAVVDGQVRVYDRFRPVI